MNMPHFTAAALDAPSDAAASDCQQSQSRAAPRVVASASTPAPMVGWRARRTGDASESLPEASALEVPEDEDLVGDTLAAFRTALRQAEDVDSPADLDGGEFRSHAPADEDPLDYFAPAFRRVLGASDASGEADEAAEVSAGTESEEEPTESLDYFQVSFQRALGTDVPVEVGDGPDSAGVDAHPSLDYFAPAFRRALGERGRPAAEKGDRPVGDESRGVVRRFKEAMNNASQLTRLKVADVFRSGFDLDRISDGMFGGQSRDLVMEGR